MSYTVAKGNQRVDPDQAGEAGKIPVGVVDLRSDTVTRPTPEMRRAMAEAEVGDDVYGEDPTVNKLERRAAEVFGKEAALFVPTGCMGNLIGIKVWTHHGDEVICEERSHVNLYELASMSAIAGCMPRVARGEDGILTWKQIEAVIPARNLSTGMKLRDEHMQKYIFRTADGRIPDLVFSADTGVCRPAANHGFACNVPGTLKFRGAEHPVTISLTATEEVSKGFRASLDTTVRLTDFNIEPPSQLGVRTANDVKVHLEFTAREGAK